MTGFETSLLISQLLGPMLGGLFGGSDQERQSFEGTGATDPRNMLQRNTQLAENLGSIIANRASQPVNLRSAYVQTPGAYSGGGLPFPIGVSAEDPALADSSLLSLPGIQGLESLFHPRTGDVSGDGGGHVEQGDGFVGGPGTDTGRIAVPRIGSGDSGQTPSEQLRTSGPRRRSESQDYGQLVRASDLIPEQSNPGDDLTKAMGSVQLLMEAFR